jgi:hypothetical protein
LSSDLSVKECLANKISYRRWSEDWVARTRSWFPNHVNLNFAMSLSLSVLTNNSNNLVSACRLMGPMLHFPYLI